jgi:hypothetical protein
MAPELAVIISEAGTEGDGEGEMVCAVSRSAATMTCLVACLLAAPAPGQRPGVVSDDQIVREARLVASGARVDLYEHGVGVDRGLVAAAERALVRMEELLGRRLDEATLGPRVRIYVAASISVSHVWRGYDHPRDPQPVIFLNPKVAGLALSGKNATYAHELAHLLTWRYHSHTLREGLADYLALQVHPGAGVGPNAGGHAVQLPVPQEIVGYLGTTRAAPPEARNDINFRRAYYHASFRFVRLLIERRGMATFLELYGEADPEAAFPRLYGASRAELAAIAAN